MTFTDEGVTAMFYMYVDQISLRFAADQIRTQVIILSAALDLVPAVS